MGIYELAKRTQATTLKLCGPKTRIVRQDQFLDKIKQKLQTMSLKAWCCHFGVQSLDAIANAVIVNEHLVVLFCKYLISIFALPS